MARPAQLSSVRPRWVLVGAGALLAACAAQATGVVTLDTGLEEGVLTREPKVAALVVEASLADGGVLALGRVTLPADSLDLGEVPKDDVGALRVRGEDARGVTVVAGESLPVRFGALQSTPLRVFVQRRGELARMPAPFTEPPPAALTALLAQRYLLGIEGARTALYDLANYAPVASPPTLPFAPKSILIFGTRALLIADEAVVFDFADRSTTPLAAPAGGTFAEVAGGLGVHASDGAAFVVGGTRRAGEPTAKVLRVALDGALSFVSLASPRLGAGAAWMDGRGVVVAGGSATAAGLEVLAPAALVGAPLAFPPEAARGVAIVRLDASRVAVAAGALRVADVACAAACALTPLEGAGGLTLANATALTVPGPDAGGTTALLAGTDAQGAIHVVAVSGATAKELTLRVPRASASLVTLPTASAALFGGAREIEIFRP
ncbi:MAG: hypothetical protein IPQ09_04440 [Myxococcales bacterium]|nr:hypothetical protein [Myxococcales bacterium]